MTASPLTDSFSTGGEPREEAAIMVFIVGQRALAAAVVTASNSSSMRGLVVEISIVCRCCSTQPYGVVAGKVYLAGTGASLGPSLW